MSLRLAAVLLLAGCPTPQCTQPFFGDPQQPMEVAPVLDIVVAQSAMLVEVQDGDHPHLLPPPQGGFGLFAGVRARHFEPCDAYLRGRIRDPATQMIIQENDRTVDFSPSSDRAWMEPAAIASFANVSNIVACPDNLGVGIAGRTFRLELTLTDRAGRSATAVRTVVPECAAGACHDECACTCGPNYRPGLCGGSSDGGCSR